ncbi:hypothetical protein MMC30_004819 [Trapelia coarctata]|nr:hypothetical protein [Trapelia coarctata]
MDSPLQDPTMNLQAQSPLMRLPREVGNLIYIKNFVRSGYVQEQESEYIQDPRSGPPDDFHWVIRRPTRFLPFSLAEPLVIRDNNRSAFLTTCRLINEEALKALYRRIFWFSSPSKIRSFNEPRDMEPRERTRRITRLGLSFKLLRAWPLDMETEQRDINETAVHWVCDKGYRGFFNPELSGISPSGDLTFTTEADYFFPNLKHLELDFSPWDLQGCQIPLVLLEGLKTTGWKLDTLKITGLDYEFEHHLAVKEELEQALLKEPRPKKEWHQ